MKTIKQELGVKTVSEYLKFTQVFKILLTLCVFLGIQSIGHSQKQNNQWRFGTGGSIDFNTFPPSFVSGSSIFTGEGSASIADRNTGALLFYTNGVTVWNANNQVMPNGTGLQGGSQALLSSTTAAVIIPKPGSSNLYYIVTVDELSSSNGVRYSVVDMTLNGGLGDIVSTQKNIFLLQTDYEKLEVVPAADGQSYWLIAYSSNSEFASFKIDNAGIQTTPVLSAGLQSWGAGHMKINRQFNKIAIGGYNYTMALFDFNNETGVVSNPLTWNFVLASPLIYGIEFSPNGKVLYINDLATLLQYDITQTTAQAIQNSVYQVATGNNTSLQLGIDDKIYVNSGSINAITCPNKLGAACGYQVSVIANQSGGGGYGFPKWVYYQNDAPTETSNAILYSDSCFGSSTQFSIRNSTGVSSVNWLFGDPNSGVSNADTGLTASHIFSQSGSFNVRAIVSNACGFDTLRLNALQIVNCSPPTITGIKISGDTCTSLTLDFQATGGVSSSPFFKWNFGDPNSGTNDTITITGSSPSPFPTHTFSGPGVYLVCVTFQEPGFSPQTVCRNFSIKLCCNGVITSTDSCVGNSIPFSFGPPINTIPIINWDFGDTLSGANNFATGYNTSHTFSAVGNYLVKATITSNCGTFSTTLNKVIVSCNNPCAATILFKDSCLANGSVFGLKSDFAINAVAWNFGDPASGSANVSAENNPTHIFSNPGKYKISATVNASCGLFLSSDSVTIVTCPPPCTATISLNDSCVENGTGFSINSFYSVLSAKWDFGDSLSESSNNTSSLASPFHEFTKAGFYTVSSDVELSCGAIQASKFVSIVNCNCKAFVPNLLTADANEVNDKFEISTFCPVKSYRLRLYNRWGKEVFVSENPNENWDSKSVGNGAYFYAIDLAYENGSSEALRGWLNVVK